MIGLSANAMATRLLGHTAIAWAPLVALLLVMACGGRASSPSASPTVPTAVAIPTSSPLPSPYESDAAVTFELVLDGTIPQGVSFEIHFTIPGTQRLVTFTFCPHEDQSCTGSGTVYSEGGGFQTKGEQLKYAFVRISPSGVRRTVAEGEVLLRSSLTLRGRFRD